MLADLDAGNARIDRTEVAAGGGAGFKVPGIDVAGAAAHPEDDYALMLLPQGRRRSAEALDELHSRQGHERKTRHMFEEMSPIQRWIIALVHSTPLLSQAFVCALAPRLHLLSVAPIFRCCQGITPSAVETTQEAAPLIGPNKAVQSESLARVW